jgi:hypothetical protein
MTPNVSGEAAVSFSLKIRVRAFTKHSGRAPETSITGFDVIKKRPSRWRIRQLNSDVLHNAVQVLLGKLRYEKLIYGASPEGASWIFPPQPSFLLITEVGFHNWSL